MAENSNANITKAAISNYSSTLTQHSNRVSSGRETFGISSQDTVIYKVMYSPNFHDSRTIPQNNGSREVKRIIYPVNSLN